MLTYIYTSYRSHGWSCIYIHTHVYAYTSDSYRWDNECVQMNNSYSRKPLIFASENPLFSRGFFFL